MKKRYTEVQNVKAIKQHEPGVKVEDRYPDLGIPTARSTTGAESTQVWR